MRSNGAKSGKRILEEQFLMNRMAGVQFTREAFVISRRGVTAVAVRAESEADRQYETQDGAAAGSRQHAMRPSCLKPPVFDPRFSEFPKPFFSRFSILRSS
jgi:hypothetical protein